ncbi:DEAD/DEAH box helicase [Lysinibacillus sp. NPDC093197]|uniref:DEAD/DEAH box helicase n=1 Tax=Lysinibacillus sp. NPDC093197 TaxID=3364132 RepID=UPI00380AEDF9
MSFFSQRMKAFASTTSDTLINPVDLFNKKLVHQKGYDFLRGNQTEFLKKWDTRREDRDIVGLMDTGSGKTLIGLLMLYSKAQEIKEPVVYLCPDNQLVEQVCTQASLYGIPVCQIEKNEYGRQEFPSEFSNSEAVLVTTFERLFNGKSIFGVNGSTDREIQNIGALLIDDAHECVKKARSKSTITIKRDRQQKLFNEILSIFNDALAYQGVGALASIRRGEASVIKQVPYWAWKNSIGSIQALLESYNEEAHPNIYFNFSLISNNLENCECFISGNSIEITPMLIPTENIPSYEGAKYRYILSATLGNNYELIRELGIDRDSIENPITVDNVSMGERLIISPKRIHKEITDNEIRELCREYSNYVNVAIIVPNETKASPWIDKGAKLIKTENIINDLNTLKSTNKGNFVVFMNRYDGIDMIDSMCRILVIDGMPTKESLKEKLDAPYRKDSILTNLKRAQTIEQGLGRAVRSGTDHCVSILMGSDLLSFISINKNKELFSQSTQAQLDFGFNLTENVTFTKQKAIEIVKESMGSCLKAEEDWRQFHKNMINEAQQKYSKVDLANMIKIAECERNAIRASIRKQVQVVDVNMKNITALTDGTSDEGWMYQFYAQLLNDLDTNRVQDLQLRAFEANGSLIKPLTFVKSRRVKRYSNQLSVFKKHIHQYEKGTDIAIKVDNIISLLLYSPQLYYKEFEKAVQELGEFLGFESTQPDMGTNDGPDNFWRMENVDLVIECKNNSINNISRQETEQMSSSIRWYKERYAEEERMMPIMLHRSDFLENNAYANEEFVVINESKLEMFKTNLRGMSEELSCKPPNMWLDSELDTLLTKYHLDEKSFVDYYSTKVKRT